VTESELRELLRRKPNPVAYDGFEPSGRMHIAQVGTLLPDQSCGTSLCWVQFGIACCIAQLLVSARAFVKVAESSLVGQSCGSCCGASPTPWHMTGSSPPAACTLHR
jgi:hypothetical protein